MPEESQALIVSPKRTRTPAATPMELLRIAMTQNADIDKLTRLMDLQERWETNEARKAFAAAYVKMKPKLPTVVRSKDNTQTKSKYAPLEDINAAIDPVLLQHGFSTATKIVAQTDISVTVQAELWHTEGHVETTQIVMPLDKTGIQGTVNKTGPHALSSSVTYGKRVAICALLNISTGDDADGTEGNSEWVEIALNDISQSPNPEHLKELFETSYKKASKEQNKRAMAAIIAAKDRRKKELGKKEAA